MGRVRYASAGLVLSLLGGVGAATFGFSACAGEEGTPGAPYALSNEYVADAAVMEATAKEAAAASVELSGRVVAASSDAGLSGAIVVLEVGGLGRASASERSADGSLLATQVNSPYIERGGFTNDTGSFALQAPPGQTGLHVFAVGYAETLQSVTTLGAADAREPVARVAASLLAPGADGASLPVPTVSRLTATPSLVETYAAIAFAVDVAAGIPSDPLSGDVVLVEPTTEWAAALEPPVPAVPGQAYPNGDYSLLVYAPATPGAYTYTVVAASRAGVTSAPASVVVTVTASP